MFKRILYAHEKGLANAGKIGRESTAKKDADEASMPLERDSHRAYGWAEKFLGYVSGAGPALIGIDPDSLESRTTKGEKK